jgi:hypothetical protein
VPGDRRADLHHGGRGAAQRRPQPAPGQLHRIAIDAVESCRHSRSIGLATLARRFATRAARPAAKTFLKGLRRRRAAAGQGNAGHACDDGDGGLAGADSGPAPPAGPELRHGIAGSAGARALLAEPQACAVIAARPVPP